MNDDELKRYEEIIKLPSKEIKLLQKLGVDKIQRLMREGILTNINLTINQVKHLEELLAYAKMISAKSNNKIMVGSKENQILLDRFQAELILMAKRQAEMEGVRNIQEKVDKQIKEFIKCSQEDGNKLYCLDCKKDLNTCAISEVVKHFKNKCKIEYKIKKLKQTRIINP